MLKIILSLLVVSAPSLHAMSGDTLRQFTSPNGVTENCISLPPVPGTNPSSDDLEKEQKLCLVDLYEQSVAICPKTWSTSPGTMILELKDPSWNRSSYMTSKHCGQKARPQGVKKFAKLKHTVNDPKTSATFAQSSMMYYHLSRFFETNLEVPVIVYREMDQKAHLELIAHRGRSMAMGDMNRAGWDFMINDTKRIVLGGVLMDDSGERYGVEFNGHRRGGWGLGEHKDIKNTLAYQALSSRKPVNELRYQGVSHTQLVSWMRDFSEMALLDFMMNQQDRVGNIDFKWHWVWVDQNGKIHSQREKRDRFKDFPRSKMAGIPVPKKLAQHSPELIQKTVLNDNDAGGKSHYVNWARRAQWLEGINHWSSVTYSKLLEIDEDFEHEGPIYQYFKNHYALSAKDLSSLVSNTKKAALILKTKDQSGELILDL